MNRLAILVDAGYLLSQCVQILSNQQSKSRKDLAMLDPQGMISMLIEQSFEVLGNRNLLRLYWYDGVSGRLSADHEALSLLPDVQFRAGTISKSGLQKGVDSKIMADLIELSGNQAISDAVLVTGDGDLVVGIDLAQRRGVRVAVLGIEEAAIGVSHNQSFEMVCAADRVRRIGKLSIKPFFAYQPATSGTNTNAAAVASKRATTPAQATATKKAAAKKVPAKKPAAPVKKVAQPKPVPAPAAPPTPAPVPKKNVPQLDQLPGIIEKFIATAIPPLEKAEISPSGALGQALDSKLLKTATEALGRRPTPSERTALRKLLKESWTGQHFVDISVAIIHGNEGGVYEQQSAIHAGV